MNVTFKAMGVFELSLSQQTKLDNRFFVWSLHEVVRSVIIQL